MSYCKANALANDNDRDKISENQRQHRNGIDMHVLLAGNVPKFHITPNMDALKRIYKGLSDIRADADMNDRYFGEFIRHYRKQYKVAWDEAYMVLDIYIDAKLALHMARRVGIENWPREAILKWLDYYFGAKQLDKVLTDAHQTWQRHKEGSLKEYALNMLVLASSQM